MLLLPKVFARLCSHLSSGQTMGGRWKLIILSSGSQHIKKKKRSQISSSCKSVYLSAHGVAYSLIVLCYTNLDKTHYMPKKILLEKEHTVCKPHSELSYWPFYSVQEIFIECSHGAYTVLDLIRGEFERWIRCFLRSLKADEACCQCVRCRAQMQ